MKVHRRAERNARHPAERQIAALATVKSSRIYPMIRRLCLQSVALRVAPKPADSTRAMRTASPTTSLAALVDQRLSAHLEHLLS